MAGHDQVLRRGRALRAAQHAGHPLVSPVAHDALSARLIQQAGFDAILIAGSPLIAARYCLPDIGLVGLADMASGVGDILAACDLPAFVDIDDGYGDIANIVHTVRTYDRLGVSAVVVEDQERASKQPGDAQARAVITIDEMCGKLRAATQTRQSDELMVVARTDAYSLESLDRAVLRADRYLAAGAEGIFIPGLKTAEDLVFVGSRLKGSYLSVAMFEGREPWLSPPELHALGFCHIVYPMLLLSRVIAAVEGGLSDLQALVGGTEPPVRSAIAATGAARLAEAVGATSWQRLAGDLSARG